MPTKGIDAAGYGPVAPEWVCEVHSPGTRTRGRLDKAKDCAERSVHDLRTGFAADPFQEARFASDDLHLVPNESR